MRLIFLVMTLVCQFAFAARNWEKVAIPGAMCGNGTPYSVFVDMHNTENVAISFMGGGACWDEDSCYGAFSKTSLDMPPAPPHTSGFLSDSPFVSPVSDWTMIFIPYCTGDVHLGSHVADYGDGKLTYHLGLDNFHKTLAHLSRVGILNFSDIQNFVLYGYSAGAIGALVHPATFDKYLGPQAHRVLLSDSPGLHFGKNFWKKFSPELIDDYSKALAMIGAPLDPTDGNVAGLVPLLCKRYPDWDIGFLQSTRDLVMSLIFGNISPIDHERKVLGKGGLLDLTKDPRDHCSAWVPSTLMHTFLIVDFTMGFQAGTKTAQKYMFDVIHGKKLRNSH